MTDPAARALLLVDFQRDFLEARGRLPVDLRQVPGVIAAANRAIRDARSSGDLVVRIGNEFRRRDLIGNAFRHRAALQGAPGAAWDERVGAIEAPYLPKWRPSGFCNPSLAALLADRGVGHVTLAGLYARACITATARAALARGLTVDLLAPAIACRSDASRQRALARLQRQGARLAHGAPL